MIDQIDRTLKEWIAEVVSDGSRSIDISLRVPGGSNLGSGVNCYLWQLSENPPLRGLERTPNQILLRYIVTTWAETDEEAHRLLGLLAFAAMDHAEFEAQFEPIPSDVWLAFGIHPKPAFVLVVPLRQNLPRPERDYVRKPLVVGTSPLVELNGIVQGPDHIALSGASVIIPPLNRSTKTDRHGRFKFTALPAKQLIDQIVIRYKEHELQLSLSKLDTSEMDDGEFVMIRFDI
ncbi:hypothetical protein KFU94_04545 [Chloroflexi bacterium TSY]|nr:hypothetical protein [Chloroflexi bacterium TSY]